MKLLLLLSLFCLLSSCHNETQFQNLNSVRTVLQDSLSSDDDDMEREDFVLREKKSLVDFLIVGDTSPSMYHRLSELGESLSDLLYVISDHDWQIAFTSADHGDHANPSSSFQEDWKDHIAESQGRYGALMNLEHRGHILGVKILTPRTPNYKEVFLHTLSHGPDRDCNLPPYCHSRLEQPLRSLKSAMERAVLDNSSLFRPQADFISIIIGNEEERAEDRQRATNAQEVAQTFNEIFGHLDKKFIAFNILILDPSSDPTNCLNEEKKTSNVAQPAYSIAELAELTGGYNISLCSSDYGRELRSLSKYIKNSLENSIVLEKEPIPETVMVEFAEGPELRWKQYGRNILFENSGSGPVHVSVFYRPQD